MKYIFIFMTIGMLNGCSFIERTDFYSEVTAEASNCPDVPKEPPQININSLGDGFYSAFNYQITDFIGDKDKIVASSADYKFTWCRANNSWIIESRSNDEDNTDRFKPDRYQNFRLEDRTYQYRVKLDADSPEQANSTTMPFGAI